VHNVYSYPGWIERFQGPHPEEIVRMMSDIREGRIRCRLRDNQDIEELLSNKLYHQGVVAIKEGVDLAIRDQYLYMASQEERIRGLIKFGEECRRKGRLDEAIRAYQKAILLRPKNKDILVSIHYGVGSVYKEMGMLDEAKNKFNTVLELIASFPIENKRMFIGGANFHLGHIYQIEGRRKMAKAHLERCLHFIPHHAKAEELLKGL
jgi:tetratricopeptide (TPR) repeat protein